MSKLQAQAEGPAAQFRLAPDQRIAPQQMPAKTRAGEQGLADPANFSHGKIPVALAMLRPCTPGLGFLAQPAGVDQPPQHGIGRRQGAARRSAAPQVQNRQNSARRERRFQPRQNVIERQMMHRGDRDNGVEFFHRPVPQQGIGLERIRSEANPPTAAAPQLSCSPRDRCR